MLGKSSFINTYFSKNFDVSEEDRIAQDNKQDAYNKAKASLDTSFDEAIAKKVEDFTITTNDKVLPRFNLNQALKDEEDLNKIMDNDGSIVAYDTETLGNFKNDPNHFVMTEFAANKVTFKNGVIDKIIPQDRIAFGIPGKMSSYYQGIINKYKTNMNLLTDDEKWILGRLSMYSGDFKSVFAPVQYSPGKYFYKVNQLKSNNKYSTDSIESGFRNLLLLDTYGQGYSQVKNTRNNTSEYLFGRIKDTISNAEMLMGYNNHVFDDPIIKHTLSIGGYHDVKIKRSYDLYNQIQTAFGNNILQLHNAFAAANGIDESAIPITGIKQLGSFAKSIGEELEAHEAGNDIDWTAKLAFNNYLGKTNKQSLHDAMLKRFRGMSKGNNVVDQNVIDNKVFFANKAIALGPLDFIRDRKGKMKGSYLTYGINNGHYYRVNRYFTVDAEDLSKDARTNLEKAGHKVEGTYHILEFDEAANNIINKQKTFMIRKSKEELELVIQQNLEVLDFNKGKVAVSNLKSVNQDIINNNTALKVKDNARRAFQNGFEITEEATSGFEFLNQMYNTHNALYGDFMISNNKKPLTDAKLKTFLSNGEITLENGTKLDEDYLNSIGLSTYERRQNFYELRNVLKDTKATIGHAVSDIRDKITTDNALFSLDEKKSDITKRKYINVKRTLAIRDYYDRLKEAVKDYKMESFNKKRHSAILAESRNEMQSQIENAKNKKNANFYAEFDRRLKSAFSDIKDSKGRPVFKTPSFGEIVNDLSNGIVSNEYLMLSSDPNVVKARLDEMKRAGLIGTPQYNALLKVYDTLDPNNKSVHQVTQGIFDTSLEEIRASNKNIEDAHITDYKQKEYREIAERRINSSDKFNLEKKTADIEREIDNMILKPFEAKDLNYVQFYFNGNKVKINTSNKTTAIQSLYTAVNNEIGNVQRDIPKKQEQAKVLSHMVNALFNQGVFDKEYENESVKTMHNKEIKGFKDIKDNDVIANFITDKLFNIVKSAKESYSEDVLKDTTAHEDEILSYKIGDKDKVYDEDISKLIAYRNIQVTDPIYAFNDKGYKIDNSNWDKIISTKAFEKFNAGKDLNIHTDVSDINFYGSNELTKNKRKLDNNSKDLFKEFGYSDHQIAHLEKHLFDSTHGLAGNSKNNNFTTAIYKIKGEDGEEKLYMSVTGNHNTGSVVNSISKNKLPKNAVNIEFRRIWNWDDGVMTIKQQSNHKIVNRVASVFIENAKDGRNVPAYQRLKMELIDTVEQGMNGVFIQNTMLRDLIKDGEYEEGTKLANNKLNKIVNEGIGAVGTFTVPDKEKGSIKSFIPNVADKESAKLINMEGLINFTPFLYDKDDKFREHVNRIMKPEGQDNAEKFIESWKKDIEKYHLRSFEGNYKGRYKVEMQHTHDFILNLLNGEDKSYGKSFLQTLAGHINQLYSDESGTDILKLANKELNQFVKEHNGIEKGLVREGNAADNVALSVTTDKSRPTMLQKLNALPIDVTEHISNDIKKKELIDRDINIGSLLTTQKWQDNINLKNIPIKTRELMDKRTENLVSNRIVEREIMGNMAVLSTKEAAEKINNIKIEDIAKLTGRTEKSHDLIKEVLEKYKVIVPTFEQHALINPYVYNEFFKDHELVSANIGNDFKYSHGLKLHSTISPGQIVGTYTDTNNKQVKVINPSKFDVTIEGISDGKQYFSLNKPLINDIKINYGGAEKSVASIASGNSGVMDIMQAIWDKAFGKNISIVANPEMGKHETGTLILGSPLMKIIDKVKDDKNLTKKFINSTDKAFGKNFITISHFETGNRLEVSPNLKEDIDFSEAVKSVVNDFKNDKGFEMLNDEGIDKVSGIKNEQIKKITISKTPMSESLSTSTGADDVIGKGVQIDDRLLQTMDTYFTKESLNDFYKKKDGKYIHNIETIKDRIKEVAKESNLYKFNNAAKDVLNIVHASRSIIDKNYSNAKVLEMNFDDIDILPRGGLSATDLERTLFDTEKTNGYDIIKMKLPGDMITKNPVTNEVTDHLIFPILKTYKVNGETFLSGTHKSIAQVLRKVNDVKNNNTKKGIDSGIEDIGEAYHDLVKDYQRELTHKEGIMQKEVLKYRAPFSGQLLAQSIVPMEAKLDKHKEIIKDKNGKDVYDFTEGVGIKDAIDRTGKRVRYNDIIEVSEDALTNMGVNFKKMGEDLYHNRYYNDATKKALIDKNILSKMVD